MNYAFHYSREGGGPHYTHMAMITQLPGGPGGARLMAAWQAAGNREGDSDQHIEYAFSDDGAAWTEPATVELSDKAVWGPTLLVDEQADPSTVWMFYSESTGECWGGPLEWPPGGDIMMVGYDVMANEWGRPRKLLGIEADGGIPKVTANKPIVLSTGEWVLPFWRERALLNKKSRACGQLRGKGSAGVLISEDRGRTWTAHGHLTGRRTWLIENAVAERRDGSLLMVFRTQVDFVYFAISIDKGKTWSEAKVLDRALPNPNAKTDLIALEPNKELVLVYNDHPKARSSKELLQQGCTKCRTNLRVAISYDDGASWSKFSTLETQVGASLRFHYPTLLQAGCRLYVAYSKFYTKVSFCLPNRGRRRSRADAAALSSPGTAPEARRRQLREPGDQDRGSRPQLGGRRRQGVLRRFSCWPNQ